MSSLLRQRNRPGSRVGAGAIPYPPEKRERPTGQRRTRSVTRTVTTTTCVVWDDEDEWPDWYVRG